jgi:hypothetical protein
MCLKKIQRVQIILNVADNIYTRRMNWPDKHAEHTEQKMSDIIFHISNFEVILYIESLSMTSVNVIIEETNRDRKGLKIQFAAAGIWR